MVWLSVVLPAHNEGAELLATVNSILQTCSSASQVEVVIADDLSDDGSIEAVKARSLSNVRVVTTPERYGVARTRNLAANAAKGDILFITDGHVRFCEGWDAIIRKNLTSNAILAATIADGETDFRGYGCSLVVPHMGTRWITNNPAEIYPACSSRIVCRDNSASRRLSKSWGL